MKRLSGISSILLLLLFYFTLLSCGGGGGAGASSSGAALTSIEIMPTNPSIAKGTTKQFTATGVYSDNSTKDITSLITWISSNTGVATISNAAGSNGKATSVAVGTTTITATSGSISGTTTLTVTPATLVSISITPSNPSIAKGTTQQFTATGTFTDNTTQDLSTQVSWTSSDVSKATMTNPGLAMGVGVGSTTITATFGGVSGSTTLTVTAATLVSIAVTPNNPSIALGTFRQFTATGTYTDGSIQVLTTSTIWMSSNGSVATISNASGSQGLASSLSVGSTTIKATDPSTNISGSTTLTVTSAALVSIAVTPSIPSIAKGTTQQFTATGTYSDNTTQNLTTTATWSSSSTAVATISNAAGSNGLATSVGTGTTTITATDPVTNISGSTILIVIPAALVSIKVLPATATIAIGGTQQFSASGTYSDNTTQDLTSSVTWNSSNGSAATISNALGSMGLATAVGVGTTTISATDPVSSIIGSATLTIPQTTQVGGIITASTTTWSLSNSPYSLSSDVQLAYGSTLAIDPGVVIYGSGHSIKVWGVLNAVGTSSAHIVFNNTNITPGANTSSQPFLINIQFSELNSGNLYQATGSAVYGSLTLDDSILRNTGTLYLWYPIANCFIERNIFLNAGGIEVGTMNGVTVYVSNNVFYQQTGCFIAPCINNYGAFAVENFASYDTSQTIVEYNSFLSTDMIALMLPSGYTAANMIGINNYWNTTDTATIDSMIYDKNDDLGCANYIQYVPFLTAPDPNTPDPSSYIQ